MGQKVFEPRYCLLCEARYMPTYSPQKYCSRKCGMKAVRKSPAYMPRYGGTGQFKGQSVIPSLAGLLISALHKSKTGIAFRRIHKGLRGRFDWTFAVVLPDGHIMIIAGRTGAIRRAEYTDCVRDDWEPFMPKPSIMKRKIIKPPKGYSRFGPEGIGEKK